MKNFGMPIKLTSFDISDASSITSVKLIEMDKGVELLTSTHIGQAVPTISSVPVGKNRRRDSQLFVELRSRLTIPRWDITRDIDDSYSVVSTLSGSAISSLLLKNTKRTDEITVNKEYPNGIFVNPHFVKRYQGSTLPISAIAYISGEKHVVVFPRMGDSNYGKYKCVYDCADGVLEDAIIIAYREGFVLFYKCYIPGTVREDSKGKIPERIDSSGESISPGVLYCLKLDTNFSVMGSVVRPLENNLVFEFDVDTIGEQIVIFATTMKGSILASGSALDESFEITSCNEEDDGSIFTTPSTLIAQSRLYIAVLESARTDKAQVLTGSRSIDVLR